MYLNSLIVRHVTYYSTQLNKIRKKCQKSGSSIDLHHPTGLIKLRDLT